MDHYKTIFEMDISIMNNYGFSSIQIKNWQELNLTIMVPSNIQINLSFNSSNIRKFTQSSNENCILTLEHFGKNWRTKIQSKNEWATGKIIFSRLSNYVNDSGTKIHTHFNNFSKHLFHNI